MALLLHATGESRAIIAGLVLASFAVGGLVYSLTVRSLLHRFDQLHLMSAGGAFVGIGLVSVALAPAWPVQCVAFAAMGSITAQSAIIIASRMNKQCEAIRYLLFSDKRFLSMIVLLNVSAEVRCRLIRCRKA